MANNAFYQQFSPTSTQNTPTLVANQRRNVIETQEIELHTKIHFMYFVTF